MTTEPDNSSQESQKNSTTATGKYLSKCFNPSLEPLIGKYLEYKNRVDLLCRGYDENSLPDPLAFCRHKMVEIEAALFPGGWLKRRRVIVAWQILHRVSEELILVMGREELVSFGLRMVHEVAASPLPEVQKKEWSDQIANQLQKFKDHPPADGNDPALLAARHLYKNIYRTINGVVDDNFWELWAKKFIALLYTLSLALCTVFFLMIDRTAGITMTMILLLGAIGGLLSGIITGEQAPLPKGHFWGQVFYYLLVRPTIGALAALVVFWAVESQFLIRVVPPLPDYLNAEKMVGKKAPPPAVTLEGRGGETLPQAPSGTAIAPEPAKEAAPRVEATSSSPTGSFSGGTEGNTAGKQTAIVSTASGPTPASPANGENKKDQTNLVVVTFQTTEGKQANLIMLILLFAGFSGDKLLKTIADSVTMKLIAQAEKTKESIK